jgi:RNA polymerase sigma factor (sigma-70 family)
VNQQPIRCYLPSVRSDSDTATGVSDAGLLSQIAAGDQQALARLYQRHGRVVLAQISLLTGDQAASEEILQDTMLAVWRGARSFRGDSSVRSWLIAIARRQARDRRRRHRLRTVSDEALAGQPSGAPGPEHAGGAERHRQPGGAAAPEALPRQEAGTAHGESGPRYRQGHRVGRARG